MLGFDTLYRNDYQDDTLAQTAAGEQRILLTRDRQLLMRKAVAYGYCIRSLEPGEQIGEVIRRYGIKPSTRRQPAFQALPALQRPAPAGLKSRDLAPLRAAHQTVFRRVFHLPQLRPGLLVRLAHRKHGQPDRGGAWNGPLRIGTVRENPPSPCPPSTWARHPGAGQKREGGLNFAFLGPPARWQTQICIEMNSPPLFRGWVKATCSPLNLFSQLGRLRLEGGQVELGHVVFQHAAHGELRARVRSDFFTRASHSLGKPSAVRPA